SSMRNASGAEISGEEPPRRSARAVRRHVHVDDLAVLVDGPVDVTSPAGDFHVGFVDKPPAADRVSARPGRVDQQWGEALHPPVQRDVVDVDAALREELFEVEESRTPE